MKSYTLSLIAVLLFSSNLSFAQEAIDNQVWKALSGVESIKLLRMSMVSYTYQYSARKPKPWKAKKSLFLVTSYPLKASSSPTMSSYPHYRWLLAFSAALVALKQ